MTGSNGTAVASRPVAAAIAARRTIRAFHPEPIEREVITRLLDAAVQAPNHRRSAPWRFFVVDRPGRRRDTLAELAREATLAKVSPGPPDAAALDRAGKRYHEVRTTPLIVLAYSTPGRGPFETRENYAAVCCAVQNFSLAAVEEGLASGWSTGGLAGHPRLAEVVGAETDWDLVGILYVGRPLPSDAPVQQRAPSAIFTRWLTDGVEPAHSNGTVAARHAGER